MPTLRRQLLCSCACLLACALLAPAAFAQSGGVVFGESKPTSDRDSSGDRDSDRERDDSSDEAKQPAPLPAPTAKARVVNGLAVPPKGAPQAVVKAIEAANRIVGKPYRYGGGHALTEDTGYDCSGTVSYALMGANLLTSPVPSGSLMSWGAPGAGRWITVYSHGGHTFTVIAGLRLDTGYRSAAAIQWGGKPGKGPRWDAPRSTAGFTPRHPPRL